MKRKIVHQDVINHIIPNELPKKDSGAYVLIDNEMSDLLPVNKRVLNIGVKLNFKLFSLDKKTHMSLFLQADSIIDENKKQKLENIEKIFALKSEVEEYNNFLELHIQDILKDDSLSLDEKTDIIYEASADLTKDLYNNPDALKNASLSENIVKPILDTIIHNEDTISSYIKIIEYDYYTHTHSLNVSVYALSLGASLELDIDTLTDLGRSALLHDIGKSKIDSNIVNKTTGLSDEEFEIMKNHPKYGYDLAQKYHIYDKNILDGIYKHHEKLDGLGYPNKIAGEQISLFPRIISICDVFDALTTRRTYKEAMKSFDALMLMKTHMHTHFDISILNKFIKMLHG